MPIISIKKIEWKSNKTRSEYSLAGYFIKRFNEAYNLDYRVIPNGEEASDADIHAVSKNREALNLQLKTGEPGLEQFWGTRIKQGSGMAVIDVNIEELLNHIIKSGERHYADSKNLILLITEKYQPTFGEKFAQHLSTKLRNTTFKGIYIVKLPAFDTKHPYEGQIIAIKDVYENHGKTL